MFQFWLFARNILAGLGAAIAIIILVMVVILIVERIKEGR